MDTQNNNREKVLQLVKGAVHEVDEKADIILFGSRARGDFQKESDWDFLILTEKEENHQLRKTIWEKFFFVELFTGEVFSSIVHSKTNWVNYKITALYNYIEKEGIAV